MRRCVTETPVRDVPDGDDVERPVEDAPAGIVSGAGPGHHTCESFAFVGYEAFEKWAHTKYGSRPADYDAMKEDLAWRMVRGLEKRIPGLSKHIVYYSLGTPLTNQHYLNATRGNIYGIEKSPSQVGPLGFRPNTEFEGLYLCGQSTISHGVAGVTASGIERREGGLELSHKGYFDAFGEGRWSAVFAGGGHVRVAGAFEEEDRTRGCAEGRGGDGSVGELDKDNYISKFL